MEPVIGEVKESKKVDDKTVEKKQKARAEEIKKYQYPGLDLFDDSPDSEVALSRDELLENANTLKTALAEFGVEVEVLAVNVEQRCGNVP